MHENTSKSWMVVRLTYGIILFYVEGFIPYIGSFITAVFITAVVFKILNPPN